MLPKVLTKRGLILLPLTMTACVLIVNPKSEGTHCQFAGITTDCGACIRDKCGAPVDACCLDSSCNDIIAMTETCASQHDDSCTALRARMAAPDAADRLLVAGTHVRDLLIRAKHLFAAAMAH